MRRSYADIVDAIGGWFEGEDVTGTDFWVSTGLESESDHPERYERDTDGEWRIKET